MLLSPVLHLLACATPVVPDVSICEGDTLFGRPTEATGLSDAECGPSCTCGGEQWEAPTYTDADADALLAWELLNPPSELVADPYLSVQPVADNPDTVCTMVPEGTRYSLATDGGGTPTHYGSCGLCSTLADLAVYMRYQDLTDPVRDCGLEHLGGDQADHVACLQALGFTLPCAQIWYWNTLHTADLCGAICIAALNEPYNQPDGSINDCLACDEAESGPVFQSVAGRTRRNTGIPNAICRPCEEVRPLEHDY